MNPRTVLVFELDLSLTGDNHYKEFVHFSNSVSAVHSANETLNKEVFFSYQVLGYVVCLKM